MVHMPFKYCLEQTKRGTSEHTHAKIPQSKPPPSKGRDAACPSSSLPFLSAVIPVVFRLCRHTCTSLPTPPDSVIFLMFCTKNVFGQLPNPQRWRPPHALILLRALVLPSLALTVCSSSPFSYALLLNALPSPTVITTHTQTHLD